MKLNKLLSLFVLLLWQLKKRKTVMENELHYLARHLIAILTARFLSLDLIKTTLVDSIFNRCYFVKESLKNFQNAT